MTVCFREGATSLGYASLEPEQKKLSSELFEGEDVLVSFPAGLHSVCSTGTYTGILMSPDVPVLCAKVWPARLQWQQAQTENQVKLIILKYMTNSLVTQAHTRLAISQCKSQRGG